MNFTSIRIKQLEKEEDIDNFLKTLPCKERVNSYLFHQRDLNRQRTREFKNTSYFSFHNLIRKQLTETERELFLADTFGYYQNPCDDIAEYLQRVKK